MMRTPIMHWTWISAVGFVLVGCGQDGGEPASESTSTLDEPVVVARGLNGPIGVLVAEDGTVYVSDSGMGGDNQAAANLPGSDQPMTISWGETARVLRFDPDGTQTVLGVLPSLMIPEGPQGAGRMVVLDGALYVASAAWGEGTDVQRPRNMAAIVRIADGTVTEIANTWDFENSQNPESAHRDSNPFDLTVGPDGALWLTDSAGNTLFRLDPSTGALELKAVFAVTPGPIPNAARGGAMEVEPVPTAVEFDSDGNLYVALLGGVPFLPGSSKVVRVAADGAVTDYATGLTMLTDLVTGPDGRLYGVSIGQFTEQGPVPNSGAVLRIEPGTASVPLLEGLSFPSSIAFTSAGSAYITLNALGEPGSGQVVRYERFIH